MKLNLAKRRAAAQVFYLAFHVISSTANGTLIFYTKGGSNPLWLSILTPKEKEYVEDIRAQLHTQAERCRKLAHRLES